MVDEQVIRTGEIMKFRITGKINGNLLSFTFETATLNQAITDVANKFENGWILVLL